MHFEKCHTGTAQGTLRYSQMGLVLKFCAQGMTQDDVTKAQR